MPGRRHGMLVTSKGARIHGRHDRDPGVAIAFLATPKKPGARRGATLFSTAAHRATAHLLASCYPLAAS